MCYVGKATKIFIFIVTVLVVLGFVLGVGLLRRSIKKNHKCTGEDCHSSPSVFPSPDFTSPNQNVSGSTQPIPTSAPIPMLGPPISDPTPSPPPAGDYDPNPPPPPPPPQDANLTPSSSSAPPPVGSATSSMPVTPGPVHAQLVS